MVDVPTSRRSARIAILRRLATIIAAIRTAAVLTSLRNAAIAICRRTAIIAVLRSRALIIHPRLARTVHRPRVRTQSRGRTPRPGLILLRPGAIRRRPVPIPHQAKVTAAVVAAEVAAVALVAAEVHVAGVPLRILGIEFISHLEARSFASFGRAFLPSNWVFRDASVCQIQYVRNPRTDSFCSVLVLPAVTCTAIRQSTARNSCCRKVLNEVGHFIPGSSCFDIQKWPGSCTAVLECYCAIRDICRIQANDSMRR